MRREINSLRTLIALFVAAIVSGCALFGGGGPEDRVSSLKRYKNYTVTAPSTWSSMEKADSDSAYRVRSGAIATLTSSCERDYTEPPELLTKHLLIGARKIQNLSSERFSVEGSEGLYSHIQAHLEGRPFDLHFFVLVKKNCIFDFSLMSPKTINDVEVGEFKVFFRSFHNAAQ